MKMLTVAVQALRFRENADHSQQTCDIPVEFVCSMIDLSFCCATEAQDSTAQDDICVILAGRTDTEDEPMPASIEVDT